MRAWDTGLFKDAKDAHEPVSVSPTSCPSVHIVPPIRIIRRGARGRPQEGTGSLPPRWRPPHNVVPGAGHVGPRPPMEDPPWGPPPPHKVLACALTSHRCVPGPARVTSALGEPAFASPARPRGPLTRTACLSARLRPMAVCQGGPGPGERGEIPRLRAPPSPGGPRTAQGHDLEWLDIAPQVHGSDQALTSENGSSWACKPPINQTPSDLHG